MMRKKLNLVSLSLIALFLIASPQAWAAGRLGLVTHDMNVGWAKAWPKLQAAIQNNRMGIVSRASASTGAKSRGVNIPGNMVVGVFRNDFAVRMLAASVAAGIEAPLRFYLTEKPSGGVALSYQKPGATFAAYTGDGLVDLAKELDIIFANIAAEAIK